jgi:hypothetical protein
MFWAVKVNIVVICKMNSGSIQERRIEIKTRKPPEISQRAAE